MKSNITFILAVKIDGQDRQENLDITIKRISRDFKGSQVILVESDRKGKLFGRYSGVEHLFLKLSEGEVFNKMKAYNKGASEARNSVLCFVDADMPPSKKNILEAYELLVSNVYDLVLPYGKSEGYNIPKEFHKMIEELDDAPSYDDKKHPWLSKQYRMEYMDNGGIVLFNTAAFVNGGGGNENFIGWGCEDDEMISRFVGLGYRLGRLDQAILLHLQHSRYTSGGWYDYANYERNNRQRLADVRAMDKESLQNMVKTWNNFEGVLDNFNDVTVIISGSYLDSHPSVAYIQEVIESLPLAGVPVATRIILTHDGIKEDASGNEDKQEKYSKYFENLAQYIETSSYTNIEVLKPDKWGHLTRSLRKAVSLVATKYLFVLQHDIHIRREIPVNRLISLMEKYTHIKHLRFNTRKNHPLFMWWDGYTDSGCVFSEREYDGIKLCITPAWSDQNHLATKEYYETVVFPDCTNPDGELIYDFMENKLNRLCRYNQSRYGTYIYGEYGAPRTSRHSDGRKSSPEADED
jgi:hypothetical protein